jgi:RNA polymerase sigma factor (sigma-70 family)
MREAIWRGVESLPERLRLVMKLRYYGEQGRPLTLAAIGGRLGISDERVRQLEKAAVERLRKTCRELIDFE